MNSWSTQCAGLAWSLRAGIASVVIAAVAGSAVGQESGSTLEPSLIVSCDWCSDEVRSQGQLEQWNGEGSSDRLPPLEFLRNGQPGPGTGCEAGWVDMLVAEADAGGRYGTRFAGTRNSVVPRWGTGGVEWMARQPVQGEESGVLVKGEPAGFLELDALPGGLAISLGTSGRFLVGHPNVGFDIVDPGSRWSRPLWKGQVEASTPYFEGSTPDRVRIAAIVARAAPNSMKGRENVTERKLVVWNGSAEIVYEDPRWTALDRQAYQVRFVNQGSRVVCFGLGADVAGEGDSGVRLVDIDSGDSMALPSEFRFEHVDCNPEGEVLLGYGDESGVAKARMFDFRGGAYPELLWEVKTPGRPSSCAISDDSSRCVVVFVGEELGFRVYSASGELLAEGAQDRKATTWAARFVDDDTLVLGALPSPWIRGWMRTLGREFRFYDLRPVGGG